MALPCSHAALICGSKGAAPSLLSPSQGKSQGENKSVPVNAPARKCTLRFHLTSPWAEWSHMIAQDAVQAGKCTFYICLVKIWGGRITKEGKILDNGDNRERPPLVAARCGLATPGSQTACLLSSYGRKSCFFQIILVRI